APELEMSISGKATAKDIDAFAKKNKKVLSDPRAALGGWYDEKANKTYLDISIAAKSGEAHEVGASLGQRPIFNPDTGASERVAYGVAGPHPYHAPSETLKPQDIEIAKAYDAAAHDPSLKPHWDSLAAETDRLYDEISKQVKIEPVAGQPYVSAEEM